MNINEPTDNIKSTIIAIASNESAYLAQFIFHHLSIGFDSIIIISNNSQDRTADIIEKISLQLNNVYHINGNAWLRVWPRSEFQIRAYQLGLSLIECMKSKPDYVMFLDIDEFWTPLGNTRQSISQYIDLHNKPDAFMFNWVIPEHDVKPFRYPLVENFSGIPHNHMKMLWKYRHPVKILNPHAIAAAGMNNELVVSGLPTIQRHATSRFPEHPGTAMIVHQMYRSEIEYISILSRGVPDRDLKFKLNRLGYRHTFRTRNSIPLPVSSSIILTWENNFIPWLKDLSIYDDIVSGLRSVLYRAKEGISTYRYLSTEEKAIFERSFLHLDLDTVELEIDRILDSPISL